MDDDPSMVLRLPSVMGFGVPPPLKSSPAFCPKYHFTPCDSFFSPHTSTLMRS